MVDRVLSGRPVAHIAKEMGVSRQCCHRWLRRFEQLGAAGLKDRSSRPRRSPTATPATVVSALLGERQRDRSSRDELAAAFGVSGSTASRIIAEPVRSSV